MSNIVDSLMRSESIRNVLLAHSIQVIEERMPIESSRDIKRDAKNRQKAYELFLRLIDDQSREKLMKLDAMLEETCEKVCNESGWWMVGDNFMFLDHSFSSRVTNTVNTYLAVRTEDGYVPSTKDFCVDELSVITSKEKRFICYFESDLEKIHQMFSIKDSIMSGDYQVKNAKNERLARDISKYLVYKKETQKTF